MTPDHLRKAGELIFGSSRWVNDAARWLKVSPVTIYRWLSGDRKISGPVKAAFQERLEREKKQ